MEVRGWRDLRKELQAKARWWPLEAGTGKEEVLPSNLGRGKALPTQ